MSELTNRYRVLLPLTVGTTKGSYTQGEEFDGDELAEGFDEQAAVQSGLLEILPSEWKVIGGSEVFETPPGETFSAALSLGQAELLIQGGHIERVEAQPAPKRKKKVEED